MDIEVELALQQGTCPTGFDRLNLLWWILALLRLSSGVPLKLPIVSDISFSVIAEGSLEANLWPIETLPQQFHTTPSPPQIIGKEHLLWVRESFCPGAELMENPRFGRAFQAFDGAIWAHSSGSALETLIQPGQNQITKTLASSLAALLEPPGPERNRLFAHVKSLYKARGGSAHGSHLPEPQQLLSSFEIGRQAFLSCIDERMLPNVTELQEKWRQQK